MIVVGIASAIACSSKKQKETYTIAGLGSETVKIQIETPSTWTADTSDREKPTFTISGVQVRRVTVAALTSLRGDAKEQMATAIELQYGDAAGAKREDLPDGRVWMSEDDGRNLHARLFVPYEGGVIMAIALLPKDSAGKLPEIRSVFETIKIVP